MAGYRRLKAAAALCLAAGLWACSGAPDAQQARQRILVEFAAPDAAAPEAAAARILSRLDPEARKEARVFERLPLIALEADAATVMLLLGMPEILSVGPDREVKPFAQGSVLNGSADPENAPAVSPAPETGRSAPPNAGSPGPR